MESDSGKFHLYVDYLSQPSRSVLQLVKLNNLTNIEIHKVSIVKGELNTKEYLDMCPMGTVPSLLVEDKDQPILYLYESGAILKYLCNRFNLPENWYSRSDLRRRALIDQYCDWHHINTRKVFAGIFGLYFLKPFTEKAGINLGENFFNGFVDEMPKLHTYLGYYDKAYAKNKYFIDDEISIVDLLIYNEVNQSYHLVEEFKKYPNFYRVMRELNGKQEVAEVNADIKDLMTKGGVVNAFAAEE